MLNNIYRQLPIHTPPTSGGAASAAGEIKVHDSFKDYRKAADDYLSQKVVSVQLNGMNRWEGTLQHATKIVEAGESVLRQFFGDGGPPDHRSMKAALSSLRDALDSIRTTSEPTRERLDQVSFACSRVQRAALKYDAFFPGDLKFTKHEIKSANFVVPHLLRSAKEKHSWRLRIQHDALMPLDRLNRPVADDVVDAIAKWALAGKRATPAKVNGGQGDPWPGETRSMIRSLAASKKQSIAKVLKELCREQHGLAFADEFIEWSIDVLQSDGVSMADKEQRAWAMMLHEFFDSSDHSRSATVASMKARLDRERNLRLTIDMLLEHLPTRGVSL